MGAPFSLFNNKMQPKGVFTPPPNLLDVLHDEFAPPIQLKSSKIPTPQYREEFTIRNNDSGKGFVENIIFYFSIISSTSDGSQGPTRGAD
jgi:hypothetical protein